ncbi:ubiquinol-cytochrome c reductase iron-sulfur subunit [Deinococcus radiopugnans]|nr:Rieske (2Fe-2S) protein [Deinococcus radiopugnans]MBB6015291.1 nitrite reductase/ring-hydroxylating ferredoxin subunit [Deinococcus radiopugnans ATCC 19172]
MTEPKHPKKDILEDPRPMGDPRKTPHWKTDFSVDWDATDYVSRREFTRFLGLSSAGMAVGTVLIAGLASVGARPVAEVPPLRLGRVEDFSPGSSTAFEYPAKGQYSLLVRHEDGTFSSYSQKCPHLGCAVYYEPHEKVLECPCHEGFFNARTGDVISGPPQRGLNLVKLDIRDGEVWAVGGGGH